MFFTWFLIFQQSSLSSQYNVNKAAPVLCLSLICNWLVMYCHGRKDNCHRSSSSSPLSTMSTRPTHNCQLSLILGPLTPSQRSCHWLSSSQGLLSWIVMVTMIIVIYGHCHNYTCHQHNDNCHGQRGCECVHLCCNCLGRRSFPLLDEKSRSLIKLLNCLSAVDNIYLWV